METKNIYQRIADINKEVEAIKKEKTNEQQKFKYRGVDQVMNELHNLFAKHEVFITSEVRNAIREERTSSGGGRLIWSIIDYKFTLYTTDGSFIETTARGEAMDSGDKGSNKCISVALKYVMFNMFLIPTEDMIDPDKVKHELQEKEEKFIELLASVERCETLEQLTEIWKEAKNYKKDERFIKCVSEKRQKLTPKD